MICESITKPSNSLLSGSQLCGEKYVFICRLIVEAILEVMAWFLYTLLGYKAEAPLPPKCPRLSQLLQYYVLVL